MKWANYAIVFALGMGILTSGGSVRVQHDPKLPCTFIEDPDTGVIIMIGNCEPGTSTGSTAGSTASTGTTSTTTGSTATTGTTSTSGSTTTTGTSGTLTGTTATTGTTSTGTTGIGISGGGDSGGTDGGGGTGGDPPPIVDPSIGLISIPAKCRGTYQKIAVDWSLPRDSVVTGLHSAKLTLTNSPGGGAETLWETDSSFVGKHRIELEIRFDTTRYPDSSKLEVKFEYKLQTSSGIAIAGTGLSTTSVISNAIGYNNNPNLNYPRLYKVPTVVFPQIISSAGERYKTKLEDTRFSKNEALDLMSSSAIYQINSHGTPSSTSTGQYEWGSIYCANYPSEAQKDAADRIHWPDVYTKRMAASASGEPAMSLVVSSCCYNGLDGQEWFQSFFRDSVEAVNTAFLGTLERGETNRADLVMYQRFWREMLSRETVTTLVDAIRNNYQPQAFSHRAPDWRDSMVIKGDVLLRLSGLYTTDGSAPQDWKVVIKAEGN